MFGGLLKSKFYSKCKSAIKTTGKRLEIIRRKRNARQKILQNDVVDLLKAGWDTNAYGRVEGLWNELNLSSCYDLVEQYCTNISSHLASMDKQRECPEECREAASSLIYAAARFSDLPELREMRAVFTERFGNSIEFYVNKEFAQKLKATPPTKDMKLQLMQNIALESGIEWNSKALEQKLYENLTASAPDPVKHTAYEREGGKDVGDKRQNLSHLSYGETDDMIPIKDIQVDRINRNVQHDVPQMTSDSDEENEGKKPFYLNPIRPPYTKSRISIMNTAEGLKDKQRSSQTGKSDDIHQDDPIGNSKPKPKSVRRRNRRTCQAEDKVENYGGVGSENLSSKSSVNEVGGNEGRQHLKVINDKQHDERDEEERIMDRLLMHYSRKKLPHDTGESEAVLEPSPQQDGINTSRGTKDRGRDGPPTRAASLPPESSSTEVPKLHARATSFQPDMLNPSGRAHPKLPDYDEVVARLAALRASMK